MSEITVMPVPPAELIAHWTIVEPLLEKSMPVDMKRYLPIDILAACISSGGTVQAWFIREDTKILAVLITQINQFPRRRGLSIFALAGARMADWFNKAEEVLCEFARRAGCDHFEAAGRRGWEKVLDLEPRCIFLVKELGPKLEAQM